MKRIYPLEVKRDHAVVTVYEIKKGYRIVWYQGGERLQKQRTKEDEAVEFAEEIASQLALHGRDLQTVGRREAALLGVLMRFPNPEGVLNDLVETSDAVGGIENVAAYARRFVQRGYNTVKEVTVKEAIDLYIEKHCAGRTSQSLNGTKSKLRKLKPFYSKLLMDVGTEELDDWYKKIGSIRYRNKVYAEVRTFFTKCQDWNYLPKEEMAIERVSLKANPDRTISLWTPTETQLFIASIRQSCIPYFALCAFAGLRPSEASRPVREGKDRIRWEDIKWEKERIYIRPNVAAKDTKKRWITMRGHLVQWLLPFRKESGTICMTNSPRMVSDDLRQKKLIEKWPNGNVLRHGFISYLLASTNDLGLVRREAGSSEQAIRDHYDDVPEPSLGEEYFKIKPVWTSNPSQRRSVG